MRKSILGKKNGALYSPAHWDKLSVGQSRGHPNHPCRLYTPHTVSYVGEWLEHVERTKTQVKLTFDLFISHVVRTLASAVAWKTNEDGHCEDRRARRRDRKQRRRGACRESYSTISVPEFIGSPPFSRPHARLAHHGEVRNPSRTTCTPQMPPRRSPTNNVTVTSESHHGRVT